MATFSLSDTSRRAQATGNGSAGPFSFSFQVNSQSDLKVYVDTTLKTLTTHYTVTVGASGTGSVSFTAGNHPTSSQTVTILSDVPVSRTSVYTAGGNITASALESDFDTQTMMLGDREERESRTVMAPVDDPTSADMTLPGKDTRKGKVLGFNATTGNPEAGPEIADVQSLAGVSADIQTLAHIEDGTDATDAIQTVAGIASNVSTVAGVSSAVSTVAGISSNVTAVAADATDIGAVAGKATEIGILGTSDVVADLAILGTSDAVSDMNTLAAISSNISTVAGISANVTSVAGVASLITSDFVADLNTLATTDIISDLNTLATADIVSDLNTLATSDIVSDLNILATADIVSDLNTLATTDIVSDLNTLATTDIVTDLNLLATSAIVEDLNLLATSTVIADMATLAGAGANPNISSLGVSGNITLADNGKAIFGAGSDLQIYHDGSHSYIHDAGTGDLYVRADDDLRLQVRNSADDDWVNALHLNSGGETAIHYNGNKKLATTSTGIDVTGTVTADAYALDSIALPSAGTATIFNRNTDNNLYIQTDSGNTVYLLDGSQNTMYAASPTSHIFQISNAEKMRITSSGSVGIGTSLPSDDVEISTSADGKGLTIKNAGNNRPYLNFDSNRSSAGNNLAELHFKWNGTDVARIIAVAGSDTTNKDDGHITFSTSSTGSVDERMRIASDGSVGIGTSSPTEALTVTGGNIQVDASSRKIGFKLSGNSNAGYLIPYDSSGNTQLVNERSGGNLIFKSANTERMRIEPNAVRFATDEVTPTGSGKDLGSPTYQWRDLWLSGGVYLGGTGAANKLDDYEEGSWSAASGYGTLTGVTATYTKIGNSVFIRLDCTMPSTSSSGHMAISGLPFSSAQDGSAQIGFTHGGNYHPAILIQGTTCYFYNGSGGAIPASTYSGAIVRFTGQYNTTA